MLHVGHPSYGQVDCLYDPTRSSADGKIRIAFDMGDLMGSRPPFHPTPALRISSGFIQESGATIFRS